MAQAFEGEESQSGGVGTGVVAGLLGGAVMIALAMIVSAAMGNGFWFPAQLVGALLYGVDAILGGTGPAISGLLAHLAWSAILGALFAAMVGKGTSTAMAIGGGLLYGCVVWSVMTFAVIPWLNPTLFERVSLTPYWWFFDHLVYGAVLGCAPALRRSAAAEREEAREEGMGRAA